jgi:hypothetical protein
MRNNYWTCSRFADWLRGTTKLKCGTSEEWHEWEDRAKREHSVRWWLAEEGLDKLQTFIMWPVDKLYDLKYYVNNRWVTRTHALTAHPRDIRPGSWCDVGNRFLPCLFNELVDYVEVELAWWHIAWADKTEKQKYKAPFWATGWFRWRVWRCPQAGLDNLAWQMSLTNVDYCDPKSSDYGQSTPQAERAREILELYKWWTETYRNRPDAMEASGWSAYCDAMREKYPGSLFSGLNSKDPQDRKASNKAHRLLQKIETAYEKEDEAMMIRLIRVRQALWT